jgi:hypothetical protein
MHAYIEGQERLSINKMEDNRRHPRIDFHLPIAIVGHDGAHMIRDLSLGGLFVQTEVASNFEARREIDLVMKLPLEMHAMQVRSRIAHVTSNAIGVEFVNLSPTHAMAFEWCFHVFKNTIPLPGAREERFMLSMCHH